MGTQIKFDFSGKVAIVTGATGGIGRATTLELARAGADLTLADVAGTPLPAVAAEARKLGRRVEALEIDVRDEAQVQQMADRTLAAYGKIDILVNTAGVIERKPSLDYTLDEWEWVVDVSLKGTWLCCQKVGAIMVRQGSGAIVNFGSGAGMRGNVGYPAYGPAKAGVMNLTKGLALEWGRQGVRVNAMAPGFVATHLNRDVLASPERLAKRLESTPLAPKPVPPEAVADAVLFLASDAASWITGITVPVDGGMSAR